MLGPAWFGACLAGLLIQMGAVTREFQQSYRSCQDRTRRAVITPSTRSMACSTLAK